MSTEIVAQARESAERIVLMFIATFTIAAQVLLLALLEWFLRRILEIEGEIADTIWFWTKVGALVIFCLAFLRDLVMIFFGPRGPWSVQKRRRQ
jgi:hypothetical protein